MNEDFTVTYDISGTKTPVPITIKAMEIAYFDDYIAEHIKKHLVDKILYSSEKPIINYELERDKVLKTIEVVL